VIYPPLTRAVADTLANDLVTRLPDAPERVLQFGEGNFLRAFVDWQFYELSRRNLFHGRVVVVQPLPQGLVHRLNAQDGLYTLLHRGVHNGTNVDRREVITVVRRGLDPYTEWTDFLHLASSPDIRYIVSNTTEAGIAYDRTPAPNGRCPASFPAKVTAFLAKRYRHFGGSADAGIVFLPCELIERNGDMLREHVLRHALDWQLGAGFRQWLDEACRFANTLVDRIVPGFPATEADQLHRELGYADGLMVAAELFHQWVIEADDAVRCALPFDKAGLNVIWTDDLTPYRTLKVRILNGSHTTGTIPALLAGKETVKEMVDDPLTGGYLRAGLEREILPGLSAGPGVAGRYAAAVFERFRNPYIRHPLAAIALNAVSKYRVRVLPSLLRYREMTGEVAPVLSCSLAALLLYYRGRLTADGTLQGAFGGNSYTVADEPAALRIIAGAHQEHADAPAEELCSRVLGSSALWESDLSSVPGLVTAVARWYALMVEHGVVVALRTAAETP
jgi:tagaturonate reductase